MLKDTSLPSAVFVWTIENNRNSDIEVTITMCMENGIGEISICLQLKCLFDRKNAFFAFNFYWSIFLRFSN